MLHPGCMLTRPSCPSHPFQLNHPGLLLPASPRGPSYFCSFCWNILPQDISAEPSPSFLRFRPPHVRQCPPSHLGYCIATRHSARVFVHLPAACTPTGGGVLRNQGLWVHCRCSGLSSVKSAYSVTND